MEKQHHEINSRGPQDSRSESPSCCQATSRCKGGTFRSSISPQESNHQTRHRGRVQKSRSAQDGLPDRSSSFQGLHCGEAFAEREACRIEIARSLYLIAEQQKSVPNVVRRMSSRFSP